MRFWKGLLLLYLDKLILIPVQQNWSEAKPFSVAAWKREFFGLAPYRVFATVEIRGISPHQSKMFSFRVIPKMFPFLL